LSIIFALQFVYLMTSNLTSSKTINAKRAFERFAAKHGMHIMHYHCNNGRFLDSMFHEACKAQQQKLTFCGVNAHFQNDIAERAPQPCGEYLKAAAPHLPALAAGREHSPVAVCPAPHCLPQ
jgi:hypothetical protein